MASVSADPMGGHGSVSESFDGPSQHSLPSPVSPSLASSHSSQFSFDVNALLLGGLGAARESRAQWSFADENSPQTKQSPLERLGFKLSLGDKKTRDGQTPKRRGPKPDSKPALTRRQELNRQAQRTHRERKELYIKALEQEVLRLKELFEQSTKDKDHVYEDNARLKQLLEAHGIQYDYANSPYQTANSQYGGSITSGTASHTRGSVSTGVTSPPRTASSSIPNHGSPAASDMMSHQHSSPHYHQTAGQNQQGSVNFDQVGIDFVLTLEKPCQDHMQMLLVRSEDSDAEISGHVLMATCPPHSHIQEHPDVKYPHKVSDLPGKELDKLLNLSAQLPVAECELPPVRAWAMIRSHPRFADLSKEDCVALRDELAPKIRCYGFGACLEDFEVRDAVTNILVRKGEMDSDMVMEIDPWSPPPGPESFV